MALKKVHATWIVEPELMGFECPHCGDWLNYEDYDDLFQEEEHYNGKVTCTECNKTFRLIVDG